MGAAIARDGLLDARTIGAAANARTHEPQLLKYVWHLVARFGTPPARTPADGGTSSPRTSPRPGAG